MIEAFYGILRFNIWLLILDILLIIIFFYSWYKNYQRTGQNIDYWYSILFLQYFVPVLLMYPFGSSVLNLLTLGPTYYYMMEPLYNKAFVITILGFIGVFFGKHVHDRYNKMLIIEIIIFPFSATLGKFFYKVTTKKKVVYNFLILYIFVLFCFIIFISMKGLLGHPREFFQANSTFRPIYHLINFSFVLAFYIISGRLLQFRNKKDIFYFILLVVFGFFLGVRAPLILQLINFGVIYSLCKQNGYIPIKKILLFVSGILLLVVILGLTRNSNNHQSPLVSLPGGSLLEIFYGNTFSDVRDFSWVLSFWDEKLYLGKSYIAALISFIPSGISSFRETWSIGKLTVRLVGFDPELHPGLRPGMFGEPYLNFGVIGVLLFGFLWGYIQRRADYLMKYYINKNDVIRAISVYIYSSFISHFSITAGFSSLYAHIILLMLLYVFAKYKIVNDTKYLTNNL